MLLSQKVISRCNSIVRLMGFLSLDPMLRGAVQYSSPLPWFYSCFLPMNMTFTKIRLETAGGNACSSLRLVQRKSNKQMEGGFDRSGDLLHFPGRVKWAGSKLVILVFIRSSGTRSTPLQNGWAGHTKKGIKGYRVSCKMRTEIELFTHRNQNSASSSRQNNAVANSPEPLKRKCVTIGTQNGKIQRFGCLSGHLSRF